MIYTVFQKELIESCKKGDPKSQFQIYKSYYRQMYNISYSLVGNAGTADKIVNESFMIVFEKIYAFQGLADFSSWLKRLVEDRSHETRSRNNISSPHLAMDKILVK